MRWVLLIVAILLVLLVFLVFTKLTVLIKYSHTSDQNHLKITFMAWFKLIRYTIDVPMIQLDKDNLSLVVDENIQTSKEEKTKKEQKRRLTPDDLVRSLSDARDVVRHVLHLHTIIRKFLRKVSVTEWKWHSAVGIGNAAHTGTLIGAVWAIKASILGIVSHAMKLKVHPEMGVTPYFQHLLANTRFQCMIHFRIGNAIVAGIKLLVFWRGGIAKFRTKPLSTLSNKMKPKSLS